MRCLPFLLTPEFAEHTTSQGRQAFSIKHHLQLAGKHRSDAERRKKATSGRC